MTLLSSGAISLSQVNVELGTPATATIDMNSTAVRSLSGIATGAISLSDLYSKSTSFAFNFSGPNVNLYSAALTAGWDGVKAVKATTNGNVYSDFYNKNPALVVGGPVTIATGNSPKGIAISADGISVYVANTDQGAAGTISTFNRNISNGALSGSTTNSASVYATAGVVISSDGKFLYLNQNTSYITCYSRNTVTGVISYVGNTNVIGTSAYMQSLVMSTDGTSVYATVSGSSSVFTINMFTRNITTGALTAAGTIASGTNPQGITISADGKNVYVMNQSSNTVSIFTRNTTTGALTAAGTIATGSSPYSIVVSADGTSVYVANYTSNTISIFTRNISTGALTAAGTIASSATPSDIAISADGKNVYVTNRITYSLSSTVSVFTRDTSTGALTAFVSVFPNGISLVVNNYIAGCGGASGSYAYSTVPGGNGGNGGTAISVATPITITNNSIIYGGGGGGGGGGASTTSNSQGGQGGYGAGMYIAGTYALGLTGFSPSTTPVTGGGAGGYGGAAGTSGNAGLAATVPSQPPGAGGAAGAAVVGNSYITWSTLGTVTGTRL